MTWSSTLKNLKYPSKSILLEIKMWPTATYERTHNLINRGNQDATQFVFDVKISELCVNADNHKYLSRLNESLQSAKYYY